jgi:heat shock protein HslJ
MEVYMTVKTKKNLLLVSLLICIPVVFSYANGSRVADNAAFSEVEDKVWNLMEVKKGIAVISIDRSRASKDIYSVKFQAGRLIGTGADNACFGSYTTYEKNAISMGNIISSRMAPLFEMRNFTEREYFMHLEKIYRWDLRGGKLELHTYDKNGDRVLLIFS